jgi:glutathione S-transferase
MSAVASPSQRVTLYGLPLSGHVHRVRSFLMLLDVPFDEVIVDLLQVEHRTPEFLARNPFGQIPVIEVGAVTIADSNAILVYLAQVYDGSRRWLPTEPLAQAAVQRWLSVAAGPLAYGPAMARVDALFGRPQNPVCIEIAQTLFGNMESHLSARAFLAAAHATIADIAMYTYTAHAPEGGISLEPYPCIRRWLERVEAIPGFVGMQRTQVRHS